MFIRFTITVMTGKKYFYKIKIHEIKEIECDVTTVKQMIQNQFKF
jgi:predicted RNA-binding protein